MDQPPQPPLETPPQSPTPKREGMFSRGFRGGVSGCIGCLTFLVLGAIVIVIALGSCGAAAG